MILCYINNSMFCSDSINIFFSFMSNYFFIILPTINCSYLDVIAINKFFISPGSNNVIIHIPYFNINNFINSDFLNVFIFFFLLVYPLLHYPFIYTVYFLVQKEVVLYHIMFHTLKFYSVLKQWVLIKQVYP